METVATLWTIGHSNRPWAQFESMLAGAGIVRLADVRRFAGSRRNPQFSRDALPAALAVAGIRYWPLPALGGRRKAAPDSPNTAWRVDAFRAYADHLASPGYIEAREALMDAARSERTCVMCAEAVWWRCHRSMIADALKARGVRVLHIMDVDKTTEHPYTSAARIVDGRLVYGPAADQA